MTKTDDQRIRKVIELKDQAPQKIIEGIELDSKNKHQATLKR